MSLELEAGKLILLALRKLYEADRANVYINPHDLAFTIKARLPPYDGIYFRFTPVPDQDATKAVLKAYGRTDAAGDVVCDGATLAPDWPVGVGPSAGIHDPGYLEMDAVAVAWKDEPYAPGPAFARDWITRLTAGDSPTWTPADVRQLFDAIFGDALRKFKAPRMVVRLYYSAARWLGRLAHGRIATVVALALGLSVISGCSGGCMSPPDFIDFPEGPPDIERVASGHLAAGLKDVIQEAVRQ